MLTRLLIFTLLLLTVVSGTANAATTEEIGRVVAMLMVPRKGDSAELSGPALGGMIKFSHGGVQYSLLYIDLGSVRNNVHITTGRLTIWSRAGGPGGLGVLTTLIDNEADGVVDAGGKDSLLEDLRPRMVNGMDANADKRGPWQAQYDAAIAFALACKDDEESGCTIKLGDATSLRRPAAPAP